MAQHFLSSFEKKWIDILEEDGTKLKKIHPEKRSYALCYAAVQNTAASLEFVPEKHKRPDLVEIATTNTDLGEYIKFIPRRLLEQSEHICFNLVNDNGLLLKEIPEAMRTDAICTVAVKDIACAIEYVPEKVLTEAMCISAVTSDKECLSLLPKSFQTENVLSALIKKYPDALASLSEEQKTENICKLAASNMDSILPLFRDRARKEILEAVPEKYRSEIESLFDEQENSPRP